MFEKLLTAYVWLVAVQYHRHHQKGAFANQRNPKQNVHKIYNYERNINGKPTHTNNSPLSRFPKWDVNLIKQI